MKENELVIIDEAPSSFDDDSIGMMISFFSSEITMQSLQRRSFLAVFFCLILAGLHPFNQILTKVPQLKLITVKILEFARWNYLWMIMCLLMSKFHKKVLNGGYSGDSTIVGCWSLVFCCRSCWLWVVGHRSSVFGQGYHRVKFNFNAVLWKTKNGDKFVLIPTSTFSNALNIKR